MQAEQALRDGRVDEALTELRAQVRSDPSSAKLRLFLFELLTLRGDWDRALDQLEVAGQLDSGALATVQVCREALRCEALRAEVFDSGRSPLVFGEPPDWMALLIEAQRLVADDKYSPAAELRARALEAATAAAGTINGKPFEWVADADSRLGPVVEAIVNGKYYWIPFERIRTIQLEKPSDLRDLVWLPAQFTWINGGQAIGLIPTRYPGSESSEDEQIVLARKTEWVEREGETWLGLGQRMLSTDADEYPLLDVRSVTFDGE